MLSELNLVSEINFQKVFESMPGLYLLLSPNLQIKAVSDTYLKTSMKKKDEFLGSYLFDEFPDNPDNTNNEGRNKFQESFDRVLSEKVSHQMEIFKYDIPLPEGGFTVKYWKTENSPVFNEAGEVTYIIHKTEDVTEMMEIKEQGNQQNRVNQALQIKSDSMKEEFKEIARELKTDQDKKNPEMSLKHAVRQLEAERAKLHSLLTNAPAYISLLEGPEHTFTFTNPLYRKLKDDRQILGKTIREAWPELEGQGFYELLDNVYNTGEPYIGKETPAIIDTGNGNLEQHYMDFVYQPVFDIDDKISGISSYAYDVTELVVARQKLEVLTNESLVSESKYKTLAESLETEVQKRTAELRTEKEKLNTILINAPAIIAVLEGPEHIYKLTNPLYQKLFSGREILGKPLRKALPELEGQGIFELMDEVYNTGKPFYAHEYALDLDVNNNGTLEKVYFNFVYQPIFDVNRQVESVGIFAFNITEQVTARQKVEILNEQLSESEAKYRSLSETLEIKVEERTEQLAQANKETEYQKNKLYLLLINAPASICLLESPDHIFKFINPLYHKLVGNRDLIGKPVSAAIPEAESQGFFDLLDSVYNSGEPFIGNEIPFQVDQTGNGTLSLEYLNFVYQPVFNINNQVEGISVFAFKVTDQVLARKEVEELNKGLKRSNEELQSFAHIASHDLQEPLRTVASYSQLLRMRYKDKIDSDANEFIDFMVGATKRMQALIEDVLDHSKISLNAGDTTKTDLNKVIENVKSNLKLSLKESNVILNYGNLPVVKAGNVYMLQLFQNLIGNAIKYRKKETDTVININAVRYEEGWRISVIDNGIGIEPQYFDKIFEIFKRLHGKEEYEGTGIGLASCKKIVELYGGRIWVESEPGKGSSFFFSIPY